MNDRRDHVEDDLEELQPSVLMTGDMKPRLRWTPELHAHFVKAVDRLGGPYKATPKTILNEMKTRGMTLFHLKSHLQKFRMDKPTGRLRRDPLKYYHPRTATPLLLENGGSSNSLSSDVNSDFGAWKAKMGNEKLQRQVEAEKHTDMRQGAEQKYLKVSLKNAEKKMAGIHNKDHYYYCCYYYNLGFPPPYPHLLSLETGKFCTHFQTEPIKVQTEGLKEETNDFQPISRSSIEEYLNSPGRTTSYGGGR